jgi:hypothetical protein
VESEGTGEKVMKIKGGLLWDVEGEEKETEGKARVTEGDCDQSAL